MKKKHPWVCPSCGYETSRKDNMRIHFYNLKKHCARIVADITLTEDIKQYVLENRVYHHPSKTDTSSTNQIINNIQYINNYINNMNVMDKLSAYKEYLDIKTMDFDDVVNYEYKLEKRKIEKTPIEIDFMNKYDIKDAIDNLSTMPENKIEFCSILLTQEGTKLKIFLNGKWEFFLLEKGIKKIVEIVRENFFDCYEKYIIRKHTLAKYPQSKQNYRERIEEYYKFIKSFDIYPFVKDGDDSEIFTDTDNSRYLCDSFMEIYDKVVVPSSYSSKIRREITNIIKGNVKHNINELNRMVANLIQIDDDFKAMIMCPMKNASTNQRVASHILQEKIEQDT